MRYNLGLNTNIFETNILNLSVVVTVVVMVVGENVSSAMQQRRQKICLMLQRIDKEIAVSRAKLLHAEQIVEQARLRCDNIRTQRRQITEIEKTRRQTQLKEDIAQLDAKTQQAIQLANRIKALFIYKQIIHYSLSRVRTILQKNFTRPTEGKILLENQNKLNTNLIKEFYNIMKFKATYSTSFNVFKNF